RVILSGPVGSHGVAVMSERVGLSFSPPVLSDTAALNGLVELMLSASRDIHAMRDPTRGGLATTLKEIAQDCGCGIAIDEKEIPVDPGVAGACDLLGLDPLYVANEGVLVAFVSEDVSEFLLRTIRAHPLARRARVIGEVTEANAGRVLLRTKVGGTRLMEMLSGEQLPRIC
ncbi:MAG: AIR synthase-related protein, partial [Thermodesulfovibrionales bacterium]